MDMMRNVFVTGGTGLTGANVCEQLVERGDTVRALVRNPADAEALTAIGVEVVQGDVADADDVLRASKGSDAAIHCAALLGGASQDLADFHAVNTAAFGPTLMAIAAAAANDVRPPRSADNPTSRRLGYEPMSLDDGLRLLIPWLRELGRL